MKIRTMSQLIAVLPLPRRFITREGEKIFFLFITDQSRVGFANNCPRPLSVLTGSLLTGTRGEHNGILSSLVIFCLYSLIRFLSRDHSSSPITTNPTGGRAKPSQSGPRYNRMMNRDDWKGFAPPFCVSTRGGEPLGLQRLTTFDTAVNGGNQVFFFSPKDETRRRQSAQTSHKQLPRSFPERCRFCQTFNRESRRPCAFIRLANVPRLPTKTLNATFQH